MNNAMHYVTLALLPMPGHTTVCMTSQIWKPWALCGLQSLSVRPRNNGFYRLYIYCFEYWLNHVSLQMHYQSALPAIQATVLQSNREKFWDSTLKPVNPANTKCRGYTYINITEKGVVTPISTIFRATNRSQIVIGCDFVTGPWNRW